MMPRLGSKEFLILDMLMSGREMYGLEMVKQAAGDLARGTVYVTLERMTDKNFVSSRLEDVPPGGGPARRLYRITGLGQHVHQAQCVFNESFRVALAGGMA
jgi:DNA-binding PadR family transcriptional regulator